MHRRAALALGLLALQGHRVTSVDVTSDQSLITKLDTAATALDRLALLHKNSDWKFDFKAQTTLWTFAPGSVINMNAATFPAARKNGLTLAVVNLGACSQLPPHFHPRASNYVVSILGTIVTWMYWENGAHTVTTTLNPFEGTLFPRGSIHQMANPTCGNAQLISALDSDDTGTTNLGSIFTNGFPTDWVNAAFGSDVVNNETSRRMPPLGFGANWGPAACLRRCNITTSTGTATALPIRDNLRRP